ncbi:putative elongator complex protein 1 [Epargyreus clarus]|uniref:putative elongator complex protein 1 n=1 Tax=Epargyreus clarus TaxID=520877 RepID=UPI003C30A594
MRNLDIWHVSTQKFDIDSTEFVSCYGHHEDTSSGELYVCTHNLVVRNFDENGEIKWSKDLSKLSSPENSAVNITFLTLPNCVSIGLTNGELFTIDDSGNSCDLAGVCQNGLLAMEWSPDQELLVLVTKDMQVIVMSAMFDAIHECNLLDKEFGDKQFITVGWGKKETQFHGSEGKQAAKLKEEIDVDPEIENQKSVSITWRGDGNLFAVGFVGDGVRSFKIFDREGLLQYTSEKQQGIEQHLSWRPSGNLIATTQKLTNKYTVSFFEKNGLKHGEFLIPVNETTTVEDMTWSSDSEILTLLCKDLETNSQKILLFTSSNYHWYLKQTLEFNSSHNVKKLMWDNMFDVANNKKLHVVLNNGQQYSYTWIWNIDHSNGKGSDDDAIVTVIDGKKILATGFRQTVVPPPMASTEIDLHDFIQSIHFAPSIKTDGLDPNTFFVCTSKELIFFKEVQKNPLQFEKHRSITLDTCNFPFQTYNWYWVNSETIACIMIDGNNYHNLTIFDISDDKIMKRHSELLPSAVTKICPHPTNASVLFLQLCTGEIIEYTLNESISPEDTSFPVSCMKFDVLSIDTDLYFLGLSHKGVMYINGTMVMNNVSSYFIHTNFLLVTTLKHLLLCTDLTKAGLKAISEHEKTESVDIYKRKIERGAKLVIAVPNDTRTVFQLPRGNLETIQPRPLSLNIIGNYLDSLKYHEAFDLMRKQRINLNLIYDHNPELFMENIHVFIASIKNNSWLSLFLSDLEDIDVTKTMYFSSYVERKDLTVHTKAKVKLICDAFETELRKDVYNKLLPLLTTLVKRKTIADLEKALSFIKQLKLEESEGKKHPITSDEALKYLLYMVDVDKLFDVALGMYDFEVVLMVANKSQKDPKEYIQMLNELNEMEENYKQFTINKHLKRFDKAVQCLVNCGSERYGELKTFVKYHSLYREALALFSTNEDIYKQISDDFGSYLKLKKQYVEAGIVFERANSYDKAIECYKDALEWELAIKLASGKPKEELIELCNSLVEGLNEEKRKKEALTILEMFCDDPEKAITYAIESGQYKSALRLCARHNKDDLKEKQLIPAIMDEYENMQDLIHTNHSNFIKYKDRLIVVRENKNKRPVDCYDQTYANKDSDLYSDSGSTVASSGSTRSFRSSKNRRKHERKVASLKEGSQYEDTALVMALHSLVTSSNELRLPVKEINIALSSVGKDNEALTLQINLERLLKDMKDNFKEIWNNNLVLEATNARIAAENAPEGQSIIPQGVAALDPHICIAPVIPEVQWKLDGFN